MSDVDGAKLVYAVLAANTALVTEVTNTVEGDPVVDIYGPPGLPVDFQIRKALFYLGGGGPGDTEVPIARESFDFYCYGKSAQEARSVFIKLRRALHRQGHLTMTIDGEHYIFQYGQIMSGPHDYVEPVEEWNCVLSSFLLHFIETTH